MKPFETKKHYKGFIGIVFIAKLDLEHDMLFT